MLVLVGGALQKLFAVAHLSLRQEKENKLSFYLFLIAKVLLRSKYRFLYRLPVWGGLGWCWLLQKWTEISEALQKFSFSWRVLCWALGGCLYWLEEHYRNISCFARNFGFCMGRLSGSLKERESLNLFLLRSKYRGLYRLLVWGGLAALLLNWLLFLSGAGYLLTLFLFLPRAGYYRNGQK